MVLIKTLLYTGVRVAELVAIRLDDVDLDACRIRITRGKGGKDRVVPFPVSFRETLALHTGDRRKAGGPYLFESSRKKPYSTRGIRALLVRCAAGLPHNMPPHRLRHFLFTWLKTQGIDDALIQPYSGHASRQSTGDLQPPRPHRRPGQLRPSHRPILGLTSTAIKIIPVWGARHAQESQAGTDRGRLP